MDKGEMERPGTGFYRQMDAQAYRETINTPARNPEYFARFHKPMVERAKQKFGTPVHVLDIACGPAFELDFLKDDKDLRLIASDISPKILEEARSRIGNNAVFFEMDARSPELRLNSIEAGILVNAVIYIPDKMLETMFKALRPGGECAVNFRLYDNPYNRPLFDHHVQRNGKIIDQELNVKGRTEPFRMKTLDHAERITEDGTPDEKIRGLGQQTYFQSIADVEELIRLIGFEIVEHSKFNFASPANPDNQIDVFILRKPEEAPAG